MHGVKQASANSTCGPNPVHCHWDTAIFLHLHIVLRQLCTTVGRAEWLWPAKLKIFTTWPSTKMFADPPIMGSIQFIWVLR